MTDAQGGFYATQDADSEGVEGKFFVWSTEEVAALLTEQEYATVKAIYGLTEGGNFAGRNILHIAEDPAALAARTDARSQMLKGNWPAPEGNSSPPGKKG